MASTAANSTPARNEFFHQIKPCCVSISQLAIRPPQGNPSFGRLTDLLTELVQLLSHQINRDATVMDDKIADYIFFPLSHVFRNQEQYPKTLIELAIKCLTIIIIHGWKSKISPQIMQQLLILLTFVIGGVPGTEDSHSVPEETELESLRALTALITVTGSSVNAASALTEEKMVPTLGHTITVLLDRVIDGSAASIQLEALRTISSFYTAIKDHTALASFLPGVVSSIAKLLAKPQRQKSRVIVSSLSSLKLVLVQVLGDVRTRSITARMSVQGAAEAAPAAEEKQLLSPSWLKATASQIKLALATVLKLRSHDSQDVCEALLALSLALLDECHSSLENCASMLVETAMVLSSADKPPSLAATSLQDLATIYPELGEIIKVTCYNWITSLPRIMQSAEESNKQTAINNLMRGMSMMSSLQLDSNLLDESISAALRESVVCLVASGHSAKLIDQVAADTSWYNQELSKADDTSLQYGSTLLGKVSQVATRSAMLNLISSVGPPSQQSRLAADMLDYARDAAGDAQTASFWLSFELLKSALSRSNEVDDLLDFSSLSAAGDETDDVFHELYSFAVAALDAHSQFSDTDGRLEAIALEVAAFAATRSGEAFRPELIDVLYPVTTFLGSTSPMLREHAMTTLNILAASCQYSSVSELIIENVDYMINSVSLRLNTFDISPASTKVLVMMTRLSGPRLLPYLDDVVGSIFAALDNYHGYPIFVESLFAVLKEVVEQGAKSDKLLTEGRRNQPGNHKKTAPSPATIADIADLLRKRRERAKRDLEEADVEEIKGHPQRPWAQEKGKTGDSIEEDDGAQHADEEKPPKTPTYTLLEKITTLTQHYLTSPSPTLRKLLLDLLGTVSPALSGDEDSFLPLINAVWPVVVGRLYDPEPFVAISACDALCMLCSNAGDFLSSRIKTEWWDGLGKWCRAKKSEAARSLSKGKAYHDIKKPEVGGTFASQEILLPIRHGKDLPGKGSAEVTQRAAPGGLGRFAQAVQIWEALIRLLVSIASHVRIEAEIFDEFLDLLADDLERNPDAREALETLNADAVWLVRYERGHIEPPQMPQVEGYTFAPLPRLD